MTKRMISHMVLEVDETMLGLDLFKVQKVQSSRSLVGFYSPWAR